MEEIPQYYSNLKVNVALDPVGISLDFIIRTQFKSLCVNIIVVSLLFSSCEHWWLSETTPEAKERIYSKHVRWGKGHERLVFIA